MGKLAKMAQKAGVTLRFPCGVTFKDGLTMRFETASEAEKACANKTLEYRNGAFYEADMKDRRTARHAGGPKPFAGKKPQPRAAPTPRLKSGRSKKSED